MKKFIKSMIGLTSISLLLNSCGGNDANPNTTTTTPENSTAPVVEAPAPEEVIATAPNDPTLVMLGTWEGSMSNKDLTVVIESVDGNELTGYNILGTNRRDLTGTYTDASYDIPCSKAYAATLNEPGNDEWDGVFTIQFIGYEDEIETDNGPECKGNLKGVEAMGTWKPNNGKPSKDFSLTRVNN